MALLAGRDKHVDDCSRLLALKDTQILFLHGTTGSGKSSFLRAGLIPFLEHEVGSFGFLNEEASKALFIRSFDDPLWSLSQNIYEMAGIPAEIPSPRGGTAVRSLEKARLGFQDADGFAELVNSRPVALVEALQIVSSTLPATLVLIVDQGEEVLTLKPGPDGDEARKQFFEFLWEFGRARLDMKLLIAIRTEYYGRFQAFIKRDAFDANLVRDYLLPDLGRGDLIEAIARPTLKYKVVESLCPPYEHFGFSYEPELPGPPRVPSPPEKITDDLLGANLSGGVLPALQIVCDRLWESTRKPQGTWIISTDDYELLGGVEGQIEQQIVQSLMEFAQKCGVTDTLIVDEAVRWGDVLGRIAKTQVDGTSTTERQRAEDLARAAKKAGCRVSFKGMMAYLSDDERRILRSEEVRTRGNETIICYTLGHDAVGLVLNKWKVQRAESLDQVRRSAFGMMRVGLVMIIAAVVYMLLVQDFTRAVAWFTVAYGVLFGSYGLILPRMRYSIYKPRLWKLLSFLPLLRMRWKVTLEKDVFIRALIQIDPGIKKVFQAYASSQQRSD
jgi:hypothetical protein